MTHTPLIRMCIVGLAAASSLIAFGFHNSSACAADVADRDAQTMTAPAAVGDVDTDGLLTRLLTDSVRTFEDRAAIASLGLGPRQVDEALQRLYLDPTLFFLDHADLVCDASTRMVTSVEFFYIADRDELARLVESFDDEVFAALARIRAQRPEGDREKAVAVHDYLVDVCTYYTEDDWGDLSVYTAYGALVDRVAVCDGYSAACRLLLEELGVECAAAYSIPMCHSWVRVKVDGRWYHMDCTCDDAFALRNGGAARTDSVLLTDEQIEALGYHDWTVVDQS